MKPKLFKKPLLAATVFVLALLCVLVPGSSHKVLADTRTATWTSHTTIVSNGNTYTDQGVQTIGMSPTKYQVFTYGTTSNDSCADYIYFDESADLTTVTTGKYQDSQLVRHDQGQTSCQLQSPGDITLTNTQSTPQTSGSGSGSDEPAITCGQGSTLDWFACPLISAMGTAAGWADTAINELMTVSQENIFACTNDSAGTPTGATKNQCQSSSAYYQAWSIMRNFALAFLVIVGLIMIIAQAIGSDVVDAYTIRKVLPRLLIAVIAIALSWQLMRFMVILTNDIGLGIRHIIYAPFTSLSNNGSDVLLGGGAVAISWLLPIIGLLALGPLGLLSFVGTALLAAFVAFIVLVIRQIIIVFLIMLAPIAIAAYILPGTKKAWDIWWDSLSKALMMFPLIAAIIAVGRVFALVSISTNEGGGTISSIIAFIAYFAPYAVIPLTVKFAGGILQTIGTITNDAHRGGFDRLKNFRTGQAEKNMTAMKTGNRFRGDSIAARAFNRTSQGIASLPSAGVVPWKMRSRMQAGRATNEAAELAEYMDKNAAFASIKGNDDYLQATMKSMGGGENESDWRRYLSAHGYEGRSLEQGVAQIRAAKRDVNSEVFSKAAVIANAGTGTGWKEGGGAAMMQSINDVAGDDRHMATSMLAQMRGIASQSGRLDLGGSGFGTQARLLNEMYDNPSLSANEVNAGLYNNLIETKGPGEFARARGDAVKQIAPQMLRRLQNAHNEVVASHASGDPDRILRSERQLAQEYAMLDNLHDNLNHMSPENARILADTVMGARVAPDVTVMDQLTRLKSGNDDMSKAYDETRKSYDMRQYAAEGSRPPEPEA